MYMKPNISALQVHCIGGCAWFYPPAQGEMSKLGEIIFEQCLPETTETHFFWELLAEMSIIMPPTSKKLMGHIGFGLFVKNRAC